MRQIKQNVIYKFETFIVYIRNTHHRIPQTYDFSVVMAKFLMTSVS